MSRKFDFVPPVSHPHTYGSLQLVRKIGDKLWLPLANNHYICVELLDTGRTNGLIRVTAPKDLPIIRGESLGFPGLAVNDWDQYDNDENAQDMIDERHSDFTENA